MGTIDDRIARLERQFRPPEREPELISAEAVRDLDALAAIIRDSGPQLADALARIEEEHPELDHFSAQLQAKRGVILAAPDGERLWRLLASAVVPRCGGASRPCADSSQRVDRGGSGANVL